MNINYHLQILSEESQNLLFAASRPGKTDSNERLRSSSECRETWNEEDYNSGNQEVVTEMSSRGVMKVSNVFYKRPNPKEFVTTPLRLREET